MLVSFWLPGWRTRRGTHKLASSLKQNSDLQEGYSTRAFMLSSMRLNALICQVNEGSFNHSLYASFDAKSAGPRLD
jgi:hypothetical protein